MRISGGSARGRTVRIRKEMLKGPDLRPTSAKVRKAVFDILGPRVEGASFLDLYAGSGAVGVEAISRGAGSAVFVDVAASRIKAIRDLLSRFGFTQKGIAEQSDALLFLRKTSHSFDLVFIDPPYDSSDTGDVLNVLSSHAALPEGGRVIVEHASKKSLPEQAGSLRQAKTYRYGDTALTLYIKETT